MIDNSKIKSLFVVDEFASNDVVLITDNTILCGLIPNSQFAAKYMWTETP